MLESLDVHSGIKGAWVHIICLSPSRTLSPHPDLRGGNHRNADLDLLLDLLHHQPSHSPPAADLIPRVVHGLVQEMILELIKQALCPNTYSNTNPAYHQGVWKT